MSSSLTYEVHRYGKDHELQRVGVWRSPDAKPQSSNPWIIYIHGGAWRDFRIDHTTFRPTIDALLLGEGGDDDWAGFASVDYRLSPHPAFPQDPASTPADELRAAAHPDHIRDVRAAVGCLQARYGFGGEYVLVGHSAGATLALQLLMGTGAAADDDDDVDVALPGAIVGLEGIYDLPGLADRLGPAYAELFRGAFPGGREAWAEVSPLRFEGDFAECWGREESGKKKLVVLGWGPRDELIDEPEIDGMAKRLGDNGVRTVVVKDLEGTHDGMWEDGRPFARAVLETLAELRK